MKAQERSRETKKRKGNALKYKWVQKAAKKEN